MRLAPTAAADLLFQGPAQALVLTLAMNSFFHPGWPASPFVCFNQWRMPTSRNCRLTSRVLRVPCRSPPSRRRRRREYVPRHLMARAGTPAAHTKCPRTGAEGVLSLAGAARGLPLASPTAAVASQHCCWSTLSRAGGGGRRRCVVCRPSYVVIAVVCCRAPRVV